MMPDICRKQQRALHQKRLIEIMATFLIEMPVFICPDGFSGNKQDYKMDKLPVRLEHSAAPSLKSDLDLPFSSRLLLIKANG